MGLRAGSSQGSSDCPVHGHSSHGSGAQRGRRTCDDRGLLGKGDPVGCPLVFLSHGVTVLVPTGPGSSFFSLCFLLSRFLILIFSSSVFWDFCVCFAF